MDDPENGIERRADVVGGPGVPAVDDLGEDLVDPRVGEVCFHGNPLKFDDLPPRERALAPELGEDTERVLGELGLSSEEIEALVKEGITVDGRTPIDSSEAAD